MAGCHCVWPRLEMGFQGPIVQNGKCGKLGVCRRETCILWRNRVWCGWTFSIVFCGFCPKTSTYVVILLVPDQPISPEYENPETYTSIAKMPRYAVPSIFLRTISKPEIKLPLESERSYRRSSSRPDPSYDKQGPSACQEIYSNSWSELQSGHFRPWLSNEIDVIYQRLSCSLF